MKNIGVIALFLILSCDYLAQEKLFTVDDIVFKSYNQLAPENIKMFKWTFQEGVYSFVRSEGEKDILCLGYANSEKVTDLLSVETFAANIKKSGRSAPEKFPNFSWKSKDEILFSLKNERILYNIKDNTITSLNLWDEEAQNITFSPNDNVTAFTNGQNLFISNGLETPVQITFDTKEGIVNGTSVHRNEFGITGGIFWSPGSNLLAYYKMDESMVTEFPLYDLDKTPAEITKVRYPMAGGKSHHVKVCIYNLESGNTVILETGEPLDQYLTNIAWAPTEDYLLIAHLNRDQNHMKLVSYDIKSGKPNEILFEERHDKYVEPENPALFIPGENDKFLWLSEMDGFNHIYLFDLKTKKLQQLTSGEWVVKHISGISEDGNKVYFSATKESPIENHYYSLEISSGKITNLTPENGWHNVTFDNNYNFIYDDYNNISSPRQIFIRNNLGKSLRNILNSKNPVADFKIGKAELVTFYDKNENLFYGKIVFPPDFDSSKKYPVIVYVYGGPHAQVVSNTWWFGRYDFWALLMAQKGYIVFSMDNRGSENRGRDFEQTTFRNLGTFEVQDQLAGIDYLGSLGYADTSKVGVYGWSYGGFMASSLMMRTNGKFKVGVGGGSVIDWKFYEVMYTERYMDTPETNPEGYKSASLLERVNDLTGKLLLVHGTSDDTVVWQHSLKFASLASKANKQLDYFPYVHHGHGVRGKETLDLYTRLTNYFIDNLK